MKKLWLISFLIVHSSALFAETKTWSGPSGSNWTNASSWSPNGVPGATDDVVFNATTTVIFTGNINDVKSVNIINNSNVLFESTTGAVIGFVTWFSLSINAGAQLQLRNVRIQLNGASQVNGTLDMLSGMAETRLYAQVGSLATITINGKVRVGSEKYLNLDNDAVGLFGTGAKNSVVFNSGAEYEIARTGGQSGITPATWASDAILRITGATSANGYGLYWHPTSGEHEIGTFIWDCPNQGTTANAAFGVWPFVTMVKGDFIINNTNGKALQFTTANNQTYNITFKGDFKILTSNSPLSLYGSGGTPNSNANVNFYFEKNVDCRSQIKMGSNTSSNHMFQFSGAGPQSVGMSGFDRDWVINFLIANDLILATHLGKMKNIQGGKVFLGNYNITAGGNSGDVSSTFITSGTGYLTCPVSGNYLRTFNVAVSGLSNDPVTIEPSDDDTFSVRVKSNFTYPVANPNRLNMREWIIGSKTGFARLRFQPGGDGIDPMEIGEMIVANYKNEGWVETPSNDPSIYEYLDVFNSFSSFGVGLNSSFKAPTATYTFTGSGNWSNSANWANNSKPPSTITSTIKVVINPPNEGSCILDVPITISNGGNITVSPGKKFVLNSKVKIQ